MKFLSFKLATQLDKVTFKKAVYSDEPITLIIPICMENGDFEGRGLAALLDFIREIFAERKELKKAQEKDCLHFLIGDYLYRHNYFNNKEAEFTCLEAGKNWVLRNKLILEQLGISYKYSFWKNYIDTEEYEKIKKYFDQQLSFYRKKFFCKDIEGDNDLNQKEKNISFTQNQLREKFDEAIKEYVSRSKRRHEELSKEKALSLENGTFEFVLEESIVLLLMLPKIFKNTVPVILHPGKLPGVSSILVDCWIKTDDKFVSTLWINCGKKVFHEKLDSTTLAYHYSDIEKFSPKINFEFFKNQSGQEKDKSTLEDIQKMVSSLVLLTKEDGIIDFVDTRLAVGCIICELEKINTTFMQKSCKKLTIN